MATSPAEVVSERPLGVQEASAVAALDDGTFLVVCDENGVFRCKPDADPLLIEATAGFADLEGVCVPSDGSAVFVLSERDGSVWRFPVADGKAANGERLGQLPRIGEKKNNGWEGIAHAAAGTFSAGEELVACHQAGPRRIGFFDAATLTERLVVKLPKAAKKELGDLNDIAIHPESRHLFVLSGKAGCLAELRIENDALELVHLYAVATAKRDVPEGIAFDAGGRLWIVTDGAGMLREVRL